MDPTYGGPCQGIRNSIPALKKFGVTNEVLCFDDPYKDYGISDDFLIHKIGNGVGPYSYNKNLSYWLEINLHRFDIVIIHGLWLHTSFGTYLAWKKFKKFNSVYPKLYIMPHGMLDPYFQKAKDRKFKSIRNSIFWRLFENRVINGVDGVLFTCELELELARQTFPNYFPKNEVNVGYGIQYPPSFKSEMENNFRKVANLNQDEVFILFLSRIHEKKGIDILIKEYLAIVDGGKFSQIPKLVIAGPISDSFSKSLKLSFEKRGEIIFTGMLKGDTKWGALYGCDAFVLPSHQENFGIAVVEALACGAPVLISDKINIWKEIDKGNAGIISSDDNQGVQSLLINWLNLDFQSKNNYRISARNTFLNNFTMDQAAFQFSNGLNIDEI